MARNKRIEKVIATGTVRNLTCLASAGWARLRRRPIPSAGRAFVVAFLLCLGSAYGWAQTNEQKQAPQSKPQKAAQSKQPKAPQNSQSQAQQKTAQQAPQSNQPQAQQNDQKQMRGLDEQIQDIKSDVLSISAELRGLEEKLLYPSGTQVAVFVALAKSDTMRLDAVRLQIDGQLVAHYIYSAKELEALRKGGVQRLYVGNVATGDHQLEVLVDAKLESGEDFSRTEHFGFRKEVKPKMLGLTLAGPTSGNTPVALGEW